MSEDTGNMLQLSVYLACALFFLAKFIQYTIEGRRLKKRKQAADRLAEERAAERQRQDDLEERVRLMKREDMEWYGSIGDANMVLLWRKLHPPISLIKPEREPKPAGQVRKVRHDRLRLRKPEEFRLSPEYQAVMDHQADQLAQLRRYL